MPLLFYCCVPFHFSAIHSRSWSAHLDRAQRKGSKLRRRYLGELGSPQYRRHPQHLDNDEYNHLSTYLRLGSFEALRAGMLSSLLLVVYISFAILIMM